MIKVMLIFISIILASRVGATVTDKIIDRQELLLESFSDPKLINNPFPKYPKSQIKYQNEAWVKVSYVIEADGSVAHPLVEDSSGSHHFSDEVIKAIEQWKYQPTISHGKAIQQCKNSILFTFDVEGVPGARRKFISKYKRIIKHIAAKDLDHAATLLTKIKKTKKWNLYEDTWYRMAKSEYYAATGNKRKELKLLSQAIDVNYVGSDSGKGYLPQEDLHYALSRKFSLQITLKRYAEALSTYELIKEREGDSQLIDELQPYVEKINAINNSEQFIRVTATLNEQNFWTHKLLRSSFGFNAIKGRVNKMDIRCKNKRTIFRIKEEQVWTIPSSWGQCTLYIDGESGSQFTLIELPDSALKKST
ncbi:MAG: TonB family protein [Gammaproteobacteria bacterium]|nr:TonB family protein [Gammaproteobacteria bacterium]